ncbi:Mitochondrial substrate carrier family protein L [Hondaea fermentalgiana]|uniref:Mitochondrial substrate carrier family protein L n=1 Tax=Hondaea fermentalgiana TaxID=2315210 RepID=A0A2R5G5G4_9STRA|nr:Mitochondrial substrate carrier family protein L [Hondaea fermentalgiana]|eukprot:GBG25589.1 Mitochondrial substrate carrier family protein L [Hondaea fermentalgiana]
MIATARGKNAWRGRALAAAAVLAVLVQTAQARTYYEEDEEEEEEAHTSMGAMLVKSLIFAVVATLVGFFIMYPFEFVRRSSEFQRQLRSSGSSAVAFLQSTPVVMPQALSPNAIEFMLQSLLLFAPRLLIKFTIYGMLRGSGHANVVKAFIASIAAGLVTMLYAFPFRKAELNNSINTGRYQDLVYYLQRKASREGFTSLYVGMAAELPYMITYHVLLFMTMEICSNVVKHNPGLNLVVSAPVAVVLASVLGAPLEQLRRVIVANPFDLHDFIFRINSRGERVVRWPLRWDRVWDYIVFIWGRWSDGGIYKMLGYVSFRSNTVALIVALYLDHTLLSL